MLTDMGRYDRNKSKKSGRYRDILVVDRQSVRTRNKGVNGFVVIVLIVAAATAGFFCAKLSEEIVGKDGQIMPFLTKKKVPNQVTDSDKSPRLQSHEVAKPSHDNDIFQQLTQQRDLVILPELDSSDEQIREVIASTAPMLSQWLSADHLIRKYMIIVNDLAQGMTIAKHLNFLKLDQPFEVEQNGEGLFLSAKSYQRYSVLAKSIYSIDIPAMVTVYQRFRPLLLQVFAEFSYPDGHNLDDIFIKAATEVLMAPVVEQPIPLVKTQLLYQFLDPKLEALSPVHKQMLRMGAENTRLIQNKMLMLIEAMGGSKG
jgi:hypothetical protein